MVVVTGTSNWWLHVYNMLQADKAVHERIRILALSRIVYGSSHWNH